MSLNNLKFKKLLIIITILLLIITNLTSYYMLNKKYKENSEHQQNLGETYYSRICDIRNVCKSFKAYIGIVTNQTASEELLSLQKLMYSLSEFSYQMCSGSNIPENSKLIKLRNKIQILGNDCRSLDSYISNFCVTNKYSTNSINNSKYNMNHIKKSVNFIVNQELNPIIEFCDQISNYCLDNQCLSYEKAYELFRFESNKIIINSFFQKSGF